MLEPFGGGGKQATSGLGGRCPKCPLHPGSASELASIPLSLRLALPWFGMTCPDLTWLSFAATLHSFLMNRGAIRLHNKMITSLMSCTMSFFDSTPSGRILNRLSKDMDSGGNPSSAICRSLRCC